MPGPIMQFGAAESDLVLHRRCSLRVRWDCHPSWRRRWHRRRTEVNAPKEVAGL